MPRKSVKFAPEDWVALDQLARDRGLSLQQLADEAFRDVLKKHGRTVARAERRDGGAVVPFPKTARRKQRR